MKITASILGGLCVAGLVVGTLAPTSVTHAQDESIEEKTHIHRLASTKRSIYDAFTYVNRIPEEAGVGETPVQLSGRLFGRLANQEGRVLLKVPAGMTKDTYLAFKSFFQYEGATAVGNCAACHTPGDFTDGRKHVVEKGGSAVDTPGLRNVAARDIDLEAVIRAKVAAAEQKRSGHADEIDDAYSVIRLNDKEIKDLVSFLKLLNDGEEAGFRDLILNAEILDTSFLFE
jgi:hypothetical protein